MPVIYGLDSTIVLDGLLLADAREDGVTIAAETIDWGSPGSTISPTQRERQHGMWAGDAWLEGRTVTITGFIKGPTWNQVSLALDELTAACSLSAVTLSVNEDGRTRTLSVRRDGKVLDQRVSTTRVNWSISLLATDPRKTSTALTATTGLPSSTGGFSFPMSFPFSIDATTVSGQVSLTNPGNIAGRVVLRIDGPVTGPVITHVASGRSLVFAASLTIPDGNFVLVDMEARSVKENGTASRNGWVTNRGWSAFEPGANTWAFTAASHDMGELTVTATPSWM